MHEFTIDPLILAPEDLHVVIALNELLHLNYDVFRGSDAFVRDYMPSSVIPDNFGLYVIMRDVVRVQGTLAFALCVRDFDPLSSTSLSKTWVNKAEYFRSLPFYDEFIRFYQGLWQEVLNKEMYKGIFTLTFDESVLSAAELTTLAELHDASQRRNKHVFTLVHKLDVTYQTAESLFEFYIRGKKWSEIARIQNRSAESLRSRAAHLRTMHGKRFFEIIEEVRKNQLEENLEKLRVKAASDLQ